jgi:hypothetical protein
MREPSDFERAYFIQTRNEIDTEKRERDQMLNFAVLVLGAIGFAVAQSESAWKFLQEPESLAIETPALVIISTLFWIRHKKLQQISDRWFVLYRMIVRCFGKDRAKEMLEGVVRKDLPTWRYIRKDFMLNIALCLPVYGLLLLQCLRGHFSNVSWRMVLPILVIILHFGFSSLILRRGLRDPLPPVLNKTSEEDLI